MKRLTVLSFTVLLLGTAACAQNPAEDPDRQERIISNLRYEFPQLQEATLEIRELGPSGIDGVDRGVLVIQGQQEQLFLVTRDNTQLYLVITEPIDASRDAEALAAADEQRLEEAAREAASRGHELAAAFADQPVRGNPDAPVTVIEFSDFQCPYCARAFSTVEHLIENNPDRVRLIYVHYPLPNHQWARPAALATLCAAQQDDGAFWTLHDGYFQHQREMTAANVVNRSREWLGGTAVNLDQWQACMEDEGAASYQEARAELERHMDLATQHGVRGTPAFFINGQFVSGAQPLEVMQSYVDAAARER